MADVPQTRRYFSERNGRGPKAEPLPLASLKKLVVSTLDDFRERGFFQEAVGIECVDGDRMGTLGSHPDHHFLRTIMREGIWPYWDREMIDFDTYGPEPWEEWDADTLFDVLEVLHDLVSSPIDGTLHSYNECGMHYETFNRTEGQVEYREKMNASLRLGDPAYKFDARGQIVEVGAPEFEQLLDAPVPAGTEHDLVTAKIDAAVNRFRARGATIDDRRHAVRDLADVLEAVRGDVKESMLTADENALFQLANQFAIRHNNRDQRGDYDRVTWLRWAFYVYLATIHAVLRVRSGADGRPPRTPDE